MALLCLADRGCATSSVRVRLWSIGGRKVHHLIDPRTGLPGGAGLLAVTVVHADPAWAEVWSKALFLTGAQQVASTADDRAMAALWVDERGLVGMSVALAPYLLWTPPLLHDVVLVRLAVGGRIPGVTLSGGTVAANAAEGEPASGKDAVLVGRRPHLVLDGLVSAGEAVGAEDLVVWLHEGDCAGHRSINRALGERRAAGLREPSVRVEVGPASYLSGESSAVLRSLAGGPALPQFRRTPAARDGLRDRPALVHNVETLARVALAGRLGPAGYRPTTLLTVVGPEHRTVVEAEPD